MIGTGRLTATDKLMIVVPMKGPALVLLLVR